MVEEEISLLHSLIRLQIAIGITANVCVCVLAFKLSLGGILQFSDTNWFVFTLNFCSSFCFFLSQNCHCALFANFNFYLSE